LPTRSSNTRFPRPTAQQNMTSVNNDDVFIVQPRASHPGARAARARAPECVRVCVRKFYYTCEAVRDALKIVVVQMKGCDTGALC
jgi:hypothetical protein